MYLKNLFFLLTGTSQPIMSKWDITNYGSQLDQLLLDIHITSS